MTECIDCGYEFNYNDPSATRSFFRIELRNEVVRGRIGAITYCKECAPFGNTKIPGRLE